MEVQSTFSSRHHGRTSSRLAGVATSHFLNDMLQAMLIASYPILRSDFSLNFLQLGILTLAFQATASVLQPLTGAVIDRYSQRWTLTLGMLLSGAGMLLLGTASDYAQLVLASFFLGLGSSIFHPEAARLARRWANGRVGWAQSVFQLGGSLGTMTGPLVTALVVLPLGQGSIAWFALLALAGVILSVFITRADPNTPISSLTRKSKPVAETGENEAVSQLAILVSLVCAKYLYVACFSSYLVFYCMDRFAMSEASGLVVLFAFHGAVAGGGLIGGSFSDRIGTRPVIGFSFWAALPFALAFPWLGPVAGIAAALLAATVIASAFPAIVVHAQSLMPARIGMISGIFYGTAFGVAGLGAAALGWLADVTSLTTIFIWTSFMPVAGVLTLFLRSNRAK